MTATVTDPLPGTTAKPDHRAFPALDGMRAFAVVCVVTTHAAFWSGHYVNGGAKSFLAHLDVGVPIFFVISGFLLSREWFVATIQHRRRVRITAFLWRRGLRVLPMYWVTVALALLILPENDDAGPADWVRHLFLLQIYHSGWLREGLTNTWSLCTEVAFYLALPLIAGVAARLARNRGSVAGSALGVACVLIAGNIAWDIWIHSSPPSYLVTASFWLPSDISWFAAGIAIAGIHTELTLGRLRQTRRWRWATIVGSSPGVCWGFAGALYLIAMTPLSGPYGFGVTTTPGQSAAKTLLYMAIAVSVIWPAVFGLSPATGRVFGNRMMRYLGDISYSIFLMHLTVLDLVSRLTGHREFTGSTITDLVLTLAITIPLSAVTFRWIESPVMRLRRLVPAVASSSAQPRRGRPPGRLRRLLRRESGEVASRR